MTKTEKLENKANLKIGEIFEKDGESVVCTRLYTKGKRIKFCYISASYATEENIAEWREANEKSLNGEFAFQPGMPAYL